MKKIKMLTEGRYARKGIHIVDLKKGDVEEAPDDLAEAWVGRGLAEAVGWDLKKVKEVKVAKEDRDKQKGHVTKSEKA